MIWSSRQTSPTSLPSASSRSAVTNFLTICSGECLFLVAMGRAFLPTAIGHKTLTQRRPETSVADFETEFTCHMPTINPHQ